MKTTVKSQNDGAFSFFFNGNRVNVKPADVMKGRNPVLKEIVRELYREFKHSGDTEIDTFLEEHEADDLIEYSKINPHLQGRARVSSDDLRSKVIRLAHENPSLRPHLLPLLTGDDRI